MVLSRRFAQVSSDDEDEVPTRSNRRNSASPEDSVAKRRKRMKLRRYEDVEEEEMERKRKRKGKKEEDDTDDMEEETPPEADEEEEEEEKPDDANPIGDSVKITGKGKGRRTHYEQFEYDGNKYDLEDLVLLVPEDKSQKPYVAIIKMPPKKGAKKKKNVRATPAATSVASSGSVVEWSNSTRDFGSEGHSSEAKNQSSHSQLEALQAELLRYQRRFGEQKWDEEHSVDVRSRETLLPHGPAVETRVFTPPPPPPPSYVSVEPRAPYPPPPQVHATPGLDFGLVTPGLESGSCSVAKKKFKEKSCGKF